MRRRLNRWRFTETPYNCESPTAHPELAALGEEHRLFHHLLRERSEAGSGNARAWQACRAVFHKFDQWEILSAIAMPDHLHLLAAPTDREVSVSAFAKWFKRWFNQEYQHGPSVSGGTSMPWSWQEGCLIVFCGLKILCQKNGNIFVKIQFVKDW